MIPAYFGEFLVARQRLTRHQLLQAIQFQHRYPAVRIGECVVALGFLQLGDIEAELTAWQATQPRRIARGTVPPTA